MSSATVLKIDKKPPRKSRRGRPPKFQSVWLQLAAENKAELARLEEMHRMETAVTPSTNSGGESDGSRGCGSVEMIDEVNANTDDTPMIETPYPFRNVGGPLLMSKLDAANNNNGMQQQFQSTSKSQFVRVATPDSSAHQSSSTDVTSDGNAIQRNDCNDNGSHQASSPVNVLQRQFSHGPHFIPHKTTSSLVPSTSYVLSSSRSTDSVYFNSFSNGHQGETPACIAASDIFDRRDQTKIIRHDTPEKQLTTWSTSTSRESERNNTNNVSTSLKRKANGGKFNAGSVVGSVAGSVSGSVVGSVAGSVSGSVVGSVAGSVVGSVAGSVAGSVTGYVGPEVNGLIWSDMHAHQDPFEVSCTRRHSLNVDPGPLRAWTSPFTYHEKRRSSESLASTQPNPNNPCECHCHRRQFPDIRPESSPPCLAQLNINALDSMEQLPCDGVPLDLSVSRRNSSLTERSSNCPDSGKNWVKHAEPNPDEISSRIVVGGRPLIPVFPLMTSASQIPQPIAAPYRMPEWDAKVPDRTFDPVLATSFGGNMQVTMWNVDQVIRFVSSIPGCREYGEAFREQGIDGSCLLELNQEHLLNVIEMKLGPALHLLKAIGSLGRHSLINIF